MLRDGRRRHADRWGATECASFRRGPPLAAGGVLTAPETVRVGALMLLIDGAIGRRRRHRRVAEDRHGLDVGRAPRDASPLEPVRPVIVASTLPSRIA